MLPLLGTALGRAVAQPPPLSAAGRIELFVDRLELPPVEVLANCTVLDLTAARGVHQFHSQLPRATNTFGYGELGYLGPSVVAQAETTALVRLFHQLGTHPFASAIDPMLMGVARDEADNPRLTTHLHGGTSRPDSDGHPEDTIRRGQLKQHQWSFGREAKLLWYHDHALGTTRLNVHAGLLGACLVRDAFDTGDASNQLGLPSGPYEWPLILQDKVLDLHTGNQLYPPQPWAPEFFGDLPTVNGRVAPNLPVDCGVYRFRVLNGCNARVLRFGLHTEIEAGPAPAWYVIGTDQGLLNQPERLAGELVIAPGERYDVLVDFRGLRAGTEVRLRNSAGEPYPADEHDVTWLGTSTQIVDWLRFVVTGRRGHQTLPTSLRGGRHKPALLPATPTCAHERTVTLLEMPDGNPNGAGFMVMLNNLAWDTSDVDVLGEGTVEIWNIVNTTEDAHPIHLHLVRFRVLDRRPFAVERYLADNPTPAMGTRWSPTPGAEHFDPAQPAVPAPAHEAGWKDTVLALPGEVTRIAVEVPDQRALGFDPDAWFTSASNKALRGYVYHCHILEHEDHDMMLPMRIAKLSDP